MEETQETNEFPEDNLNNPIESATEPSKLDIFVEKHRSKLIIGVSIAMLVLIVFLIANMWMVKMNLHPVEYCIQALKESGCVCNGRTYI